MCRTKKLDTCVLLSEDTKTWNKRAPLATPKEFDSYIEQFVKGVELFLDGDKSGASAIFEKIDSDKIRAFTQEHGGISGKIRFNILNKNREPINSIKIPKEDRDRLRNPSKYNEKIFDRDGYRCRYCDNRVISIKFLKKFVKLFDDKSFMKGRKNIDKHGIIHLCWPVLDHVDPWSSGGATDPSNLVTSCGPCNYGKMNYTCEELGIHDPREKEALKDSWDGMSSKLEALKNL